MLFLGEQKRLFTDEYGSLPLTYSYLCPNELGHFTGDFNPILPDETVIGIGVDKLLGIRHQADNPRYVLLRDVEILSTRNNQHGHARFVQGLVNISGANQSIRQGKGLESHEVTNNARGLTHSIDILLLELRCLKIPAHIIQDLGFEHPANDYAIEQGNPNNRRQGYAKISRRQQGR